MQTGIMRKTLLITLAVLVALALGAYLYLRNSKLKELEPFFKEKLSNLVTEGSGGLYHCSIDTLETNVADSKITLVNIHLYADSAVYRQMVKEERAPNDLFDVTVHQLAINELTPSSFAASKTIDLGRLFIDHPVIKVLHRKQSYNVKGDDSSKTVYELIKKDISRIKVDTILLNNVDLQYINGDRQNRETRLENMKLFFADILIDSSTQYDHSRFFFSRTGLVSLNNYTQKTADSLYRLRIPSIKIRTHHKEIELDSLQFKARIPVRDFYKRVKVAKDYYDVLIKKIFLSDIDWWASMSDESLLISKVRMEDGAVSIVKDRTYPMDTESKLGKYPHQLLMKSSLQLGIDTIQLRRINLSYREVNPKTGKPGTVLFSNLRGTVQNLTNIPEKIRQDGFCRMDASTLFMNKGTLRAAFKFDLRNAARGNFEVKVNLGPMNGADLNAITIPLGLLQINRADIKSLEASIKGNNSSASGTVKFLYNDLNVTALKESGDTVKKRGLLSFIANTFVLKKDNPKPGKEVRMEPAFFQRDTHKSFFNLTWKTIFTGVGKTIGYKVKK